MEKENLPLKISLEKARELVDEKKFKNLVKMKQIKDKVFLVLGAASTYLGIDGLVCAIRHNIDSEKASQIVNKALKEYMKIINTHNPNESLLTSIKENILNIPDLWPSINYLMAIPNIITGVGLMVLGGYFWYKNRKKCLSDIQQSK